jgi:hypothetical protein
MPPRNQISAAAGIPKSVPEPFSTRRARSTGSVATQCQSDLELLLSDGTHLEEQVIRYMIRLFPAITIELLTRVARRVKPHREGELISLAAKEWLRQGEEAGFARGKEFGIAEGEELGVAKAKIDSILVTLETRFGSVPGDMEAQIRRSAPELLDDLFKRALTAASLEIVFTSDNRH